MAPDAHAGDEEAGQPSTPRWRTRLFSDAAMCPCPGPLAVPSPITRVPKLTLNNCEAVQSSDSSLPSVHSSESLMAVQSSGSCSDPAPRFKSLAEADAQDVARIAQGYRTPAKASPGSSPVPSPRSGNSPEPVEPKQSTKAPVRPYPQLGNDAVTESKLNDALEKYRNQRDQLLAKQKSPQKSPARGDRHAEENMPGDCQEKPQEDRKSLLDFKLPMNEQELAEFREARQRKRAEAAEKSPPVQMQLSDAIEARFRTLAEKDKEGSEVEKGARERRSSITANKRKSKGEAKTAVDEDEVALAKLREAHAERRRKVAEAVKAMAEKEQEADKMKQQQQEEDRKKAAADEAFFMRWLQDAEQDLQVAREELAQEQAAAMSVKQEAERATEELERQHSNELECLAAQQTEALTRHLEELEALRHEVQLGSTAAARHRDATEEVRRQLAMAEGDLAKARQECVTERENAARVKADGERAIASITKSHANELSTKVTDLAKVTAQRDIQSTRIEKLTDEAAEAGRSKLETEADYKRMLADAVQDFQALQSETMQERARIASEKKVRQHADAELERRHEEANKQMNDLHTEDVAARENEINELRKRCQEDEQRAQERLANAESRLQAALDEIGREQASASQRLAEESRTFAEQSEAHASELQREQSERASADASWQQKLAQVEEQLVATREASQRFAEESRAFAEQREAHASELRREQSERAGADSTWQRRLAQVEEQLVATREARIQELKKARVDGDCALSELRDAHAAQLQEEAVRHAEELKQREMEIQRSKAAQREAESGAVKGKADLLTRIADMEDNLQATREKLKREQELTVVARANGERALAELKRAQQDELDNVRNVHSEELAARARDLAQSKEQAVSSEARCTEEWQSCLDKAEGDLTAFRAQARIEQELAKKARVEGELALSQLRRSSGEAQEKAQGLQAALDRAEEEQARVKEALDRAQEEHARVKEGVLHSEAKAEDAWRQQLACLEGELKVVDEDFRCHREVAEQAKVRFAEELEEARKASADQRCKDAIEHARLIENQKLDYDKLRKDVHQKEEEMCKRAAELEQVRQESRRYIDDVQRQKEDLVQLQQEAQRERALSQRLLKSDEEWQQRLAAAERETMSTWEELQREREVAAKMRLNNAQDHREKCMQNVQALAERDEELERMRQYIEQMRREQELQKVESERMWRSKVAAAEERGEVLAKQAQAEGERARENALAELQRTVAADTKHHNEVIRKQLEAEQDRVRQRDLEITRCHKIMEEMENQKEETEKAWQWRLANVEEDLKAARREVEHERDLLVNAQEESERAVLRAMESFWVANDEEKEEAEAAAAAGATN